MRFVQLERLLGFRVTSSPIDDCSTSDLCHGDPVAGGDVTSGCSQTPVFTGEPLLVNTNRSSLVGLAVYMRSQCACSARMFDDVTVDRKCSADSCLNGGTCYEHEYSVTSVAAAFSVTYYDVFSAYVKSDFFISLVPNFLILSC